MWPTASGGLEILLPWEYMSHPLKSRNVPLFHFPMFLNNIQSIIFEQTRQQTVSNAMDIKNIDIFRILLALE